MTYDILKRDNVNMTEAIIFELMLYTITTVLVYRN